MKGVFYPKSVAVIGVSSNPDNLGRNIMLNLIDFGFDGVVYPVGPRGGTITANAASLTNGTSIALVFRATVN